MIKGLDISFWIYYGWSILTELPHYLCVVECVMGRVSSTSYLFSRLDSICSDHTIIKYRLRRHNCNGTVLEIQINVESWIN